jgi:hypothetical protein
LGFRLPALDGVLDRFEGRAIGAFGGGDVALDGGERFAMVLVGEGGGERGFGGVVEEEVGAFDGLCEGFRFDAVGPVEAPEGFGELIGEEGFFGGDGGEGGEGLLAEFVEIGLGFAGQDEAGGAEAVGEAVLAGGGFAFGGAGAGGFAGVLAVGGRGGPAPGRKGRAWG